MFYFFFQAEDGIRDIGVTGVQTCALPICLFNSFLNSLIVLILPPCSSKSPCEKLSLAALTPAKISSLKYSLFSLAGPIVKTILVLCINYLLPFKLIFVFI